jgi:predicted transposase YbfD/YdcC
MLQGWGASSALVLIDAMKCQTKLEKIIRNRKATHGPHTKGLLIT